MVSVLAVVGILAILLLHTVIAAILTRLLRVRLRTSWGPLLYALTVIPIVLFLSTLIISGVFGLGPNLGGVGTVLFVTILAPLAIGLAIDYLWMPAPEDTLELPENQ